MYPAKKIISNPIGTVAKVPDKQQNIVKEISRITIRKPSPDHSTFSRFLKRIRKEVLIELNSEVLREFSKRRLIINEGIAVVAGLVRSASWPMNSDELKKAKSKRQSSEGQLDKKVGR